MYIIGKKHIALQIHELKYCSLGILHELPAFLSLFIWLHDTIYPNGEVSISTSKNPCVCLDMKSLGVGGMKAIDFHLVFLYLSQLLYQCNIYWCQKTTWIKVYAFMILLVTCQFTWMGMVDVSYYFTAFLVFSCWHDALAAPKHSVHKHRLHKGMFYLYLEQQENSWCCLSIRKPISPCINVVSFIFN